MKKILLTGLVLAAALLTHASSVSAATYSGQLVKASGQAVYYVNSTDGKRYVFPNEATYKSWYNDFSSVVTISDSELASLMIGGNVTYRPGTKLVKITTDPKVYAISGGGYLRWVTSETVAQSLFGASWANNVNDIPDAFFINYRIGAPIQAASEYQPTQELNSNLTIDADIWKRIAIVDPVFPTPTTTTQPTVPTTTQPTVPATPTTTTSGVNYQGTLTVREAQPIMSGASYTVVASANPSGGLTSVTVQPGTSTTAATCESDYCQPRFTAPYVAVTTTQTITGVFTWLGSRRVTTTTQVVIIPRPNSNQVTFAPMSSTTHVGDTRTVEARIGSEFSAHIIRVYMDGLLVKECADDSICIWSVPEQGTIGTQHVFTAYAEDRNGLSIQSAPVTVSVVAR